jgi:hypothetical protein
MRKRNIQRLSERRPLWSDGGSYCTGCRKFVFPSEETAEEKLEDLKAAPKVRRQKHSHLLHLYVRLFIWYRFLWHVSRLNLHLVPIHPDHCAGLAFLGKSAYAFGPILFAQGAMLAGVVASRILYRGESLLSFKLEMGGFVIFFVLAILGPLLMFTPKMAALKRKGLADYGQVAQDYVNSFEEKWVLNTPPSEEVLGSGDIQSLADLNSSYEIVSDMRAVPFGLEDIFRLAAATAAPLVPLLLTIFPLEELIMRLVKIVF